LRFELEVEGTNGVKTKYTLYGKGKGSGSQQSTKDSKLICKHSGEFGHMNSRGSEMKGLICPV
jgi:hypothetical protein